MGITERKWLAIAPRSFTANGGVEGQVTLASTLDFRVKQKITLKASTLSPLQLEVKRVTSPTTLEVGPPGQIDQRSNISAYTTALNATIDAAEQPRSSIPLQELERVDYEEEPVIARRRILVDSKGEKIGSVKDSSGINRLAVDGQFHAEVDVQVDVDSDGVYDASSNPDPDSIGLIAHERSESTDETQQTQRVTAKRGTTDTDTVSQDVSLHDHDGNKFDVRNPLPTTGSFEKFFPLIAASKWMNLANYDQVVPTYSEDGSTLTLAYMEDGVLIGEAVIVYSTLNSWELVLNRYLNDDDGSQLLDDDTDGTPLNLD